MSNNLFNKIKSYSKSLGFQEVKVTNFDGFKYLFKKFARIYKKNFYGEMSWIKEKAKIRENPKNIWDEAKVL